ncbi:pentapeptide repeat-containing protein [Actinosynnema sp. NPDC023794]
MQLQKETIADTRYDSAEKRITELQTRAVDQLGSDKAAVRLGGLYALERLAQSSPEHRQAIVNVVCAYLRMPAPLATGTNGHQSPRQRRVVAGRPRMGTAASMRNQNIGEEWHVRQAFQQVLKSHLQNPREKKSEQSGGGDTAFWTGIRVDLSGAVLLDFDLAGCRVTEAIFSRATFLGQARFVGINITDRALFDTATFTGEANFAHATFTHNVFFDNAEFQGDCYFGGAALNGLVASFENVTFCFHPRFWGTQFKAHPMGLVNVDRSKQGSPAKWSPVGWKGGDDKLKLVSVKQLPTLTEEEKRFMVDGVTRSATPDAKDLKGTDS